MTAQVPGRQRWLDAIRGIAVLAVVVDHLAYLAFPGTWAALMGVWHIGAYGGTLIFLVTGYVIPASLERGGRVGRFWVSRVFRLYPLWIVMAIGVVGLGRFGLAPAPAELWQQPGTVLLANSTLLQSLLGVPPLLVVLWTLSYQMAFYLLVTATFRLGLHGRSAEIAIGLGVLSLLLTGLRQVSEPIALPRAGWFVAAVVAVLSASLAMALSRARAANAAGAAVLAVVVLGLVARDQHADGWGMIVLALLFLGSALYHARQGRVGWARAVVAVATLLAAATAAAWGGHDPAFLQPEPGDAAARAWLFAVGSGVVTFALAPLLRDRLVPRSLALVGIISYSVFLMHLGVIWMLLPWLKPAAGGPWWWQGVALAGLLAVLLPGCYLTYRLVERPGQRLGRALLTRVEATPAPSPAPTADPRPATDDLRVSVVIPNYNKAKTLGACLAAVYAQTAPPAEVIVVDDASTDHSRQIAQRFPCRVLAFDVNRGPSAARNAGAAAATGEVLFFVDSDIGLESDALANALRLLREHPQCAVVQGIYDWRPLFADSRVEAYKTLSEHFWRRQDVGPSTATLFGLTAIRRPVFHEVGGFDEGISESEDIEFGTRLPARYLILTSDKVIGRHDDVDRFWPYLTEHVRRAHRYGALLARLILVRTRHAGRPATRRRRVDVAAVASMASCVLAVVTLPLALLSGWLLLVPLALVTVFTAIDRRLFGFVWQQRGAAFLGYVLAMQFLMYATQFAGMLTGALHGVTRATGALR